MHERYLFSVFVCNWGEPDSRPYSGSHVCLARHPTCTYVVVATHHKAVHFHGHPFLRIMNGCTIVTDEKTEGLQGPLS